MRCYMEEVEQSEFRQAAIEVAEGSDKEALTSHQVCRDRLTAISR